MTNTTEKLIAECLALVAPAEAAYRSRWRLGTLLRVDPDLHQALIEQIDLYNSSLVIGGDSEAREHAEAMVRGWQAACRALEAPLEPDDAFLHGFDPATGLRVVISDCRASVARVQAHAGERVIIVTPDEVARMFAGLNILAEIKTAFPDAEIIELYPQAATS